MAKKKGMLERLQDAEKIAAKSEKEYRQETGEKEKSVMVRLGESYHVKLKQIVHAAFLRGEKSTLQSTLEDLVEERYRQEFGE